MAKIEFSKVPKCEQIWLFGVKMGFQGIRGHFKIFKTHLNGPTRASHLIPLSSLSLLLPVSLPNYLSPLQLLSLSSVKPDDLSSSLHSLLSLFPTLSISLSLSSRSHKWWLINHPRWSNDNTSQRKEFRRCQNREGQLLNGQITAVGGGRWRMGGRGGTTVECCSSATPIAGSEPQMIHLNPLFKMVLFVSDKSAQIFGTHFRVKNRNFTS